MIDSRGGSNHRCILVPLRHTPPLSVARLHDWPIGRNKRPRFPPSLQCRMVWALPPQNTPAAAISIQITKITPLVRPCRIFISSPTAHPTRIPRPQSRIIPDRFSCVRVYLIVWTPGPVCIYIRLLRVLQHFILHTIVTHPRHDGIQFDPVDLRPRRECEIRAAVGRGRPVSQFALDGPRHVLTTLSTP